MLAYVAISTEKVPPKIQGLDPFRSREALTEWEKTAPK
jgi:hypothetical protein